MYQLTVSHHRISIVYIRRLYDYCVELIPRTIGKGYQNI
jgi:hypothetical protein